MLVNTGLLARLEKVVDVSLSKVCPISICHPPLKDLSVLYVTILSSVHWTQITILIY